MNIGRRQNLLRIQKEHQKENDKLIESNNIILVHKENIQKENDKIYKLKEEIDSLKTKINEKIAKRIIINTDLNVQQKLKEKLKHKNEASIIHITNIKSELVALEKLSETFLNKNVEDSKLEEMQSDFDKYHLEFENTREVKEQLNAHILQEKNKLSLVQRDVSIINNSINEKDLLLEDNKSNQEIKTRRLGELKIQSDKIENDIIELYKSEKSEFENLNSREESYFTAKSGIFDMEKDIFELRGKRDKLVHLLTNFKENLTEKNHQLSAWKDRIDVEFHERIDKYKIPEFHENISLDQLTQERERLQLKLQGYGDINPLAIEAYDEIKLRVDRITEEAG